MPGVKITKVQKQKILELVDLGVSPEKAATMIHPPISPASARRIITGVTRAMEMERNEVNLPDPKPWAELSTDARSALEDYNVFCEIFLCRRPSAWRRDAAMRAVDLISDRQVRSYEVVNIFPGAGKTTQWTHDLPIWLTAGGGTLDPAHGRALRFLLGSYTMSVSTHYVTRVRRTLELVNPYWDKEQRLEATHSLVREFGRFKPQISMGEEKLWAKDQFLVAQVGGRDIYEKEPTFMAASRESGFLGERFDYCAWDDLITKRNARKFLNPEFVEEFTEWFEDEAETRVEPGGVLFLVGQRLGSNDLYRNRLDFRYTDEDGAERPRYSHTIYPAHHEDLCKGPKRHEPWDPETNTGCLTDPDRLPFQEIAPLQAKPNYRTVYQQEDADPGAILVLPQWLDGQEDPFGFPAIGCYDRERGWGAHPEGVGPLIDYAVVDPSGKAGFWAIEWWAIQNRPEVEPNERFRYLIYGIRKRMQAGEFLDYDPIEQRLVGVMEELQRTSVMGHHPIRVWVVEANSAHAYLQQVEAYRIFRRKWSAVSVFPHETQRNKADPEMGVEAAMPMPYRSGLKRLPGLEQSVPAWDRKAMDAMGYLKQKRKELTTYPHSTTSDTVMADWLGEFNLTKIVRAAQRSLPHDAPDTKLPAYLARQLEIRSTRQPRTGTDG